MPSARSLVWFLLAAGCASEPRVHRERPVGLFEPRTGVAGGARVVEEPRGDPPRLRIEGVRPEIVARVPSPMPTVVAVSRERRIFLAFPRWGDRVPFTLGEFRDGRVTPFPDAIFAGERGEAAQRLVSVQSVVVDAQDRLWALDTGSVEFGPVQAGGPKLVAFDLRTRRVIRRIDFPSDVALPTTYLNDVRFDLTRGEGFAVITDSSSTGPNALIVVDLASGRSWRRLHGHASVTAEPGFVASVEGRPLLEAEAGEEPRPLRIGADGIAIDLFRRRVFFCPLSGRKLWTVSLDALEDPNLTDEQVAATLTDLGDRGFASDGLECDQHGVLYLTDYENGTVRRRTHENTYEAITAGPEISWPDALAMGPDAHLYFTSNQLHRQARFQGGVDRRRPPYTVMRIPVDLPENEQRAEAVDR